MSSPGLKVDRASNLIDEFLPRYDARERHEITIAAPPEVVYDTLQTVDFGHSTVVRALLALRAVPSLASRTTAPAPRGRLTLKTFVYGNATVLGEIPGREVVLGVVGPFWRLCPRLERVESTRFREGPWPGTAFAAWSFAVDPVGAGGSRLVTETRVLTGDEASRRRFLRYWTIVHPFSAVIRRLMLRAVRRNATGKFRA